MRPRIHPNHKRRLIVEGQDLRGIEALAACHGLDWGDPDPRLPYLQAAENGQALKHLALALKGPYTHLGIVLDAGPDLRARWQSVRDVLDQAHVETPGELPPPGWVGPPGPPRMGVWIMPDNVAPGRLETFMARLLPTQDPIWPWAQDATRKARELGAATREPERARYLAWLAWQEAHGTAPIPGLRREAPAAVVFVRWFERVFLGE